MMNKLGIRIGLATVGLSLALGGCGKQEPEVVTPASDASPGIEIVDVLDRNVTLERPAERVLLGEGRFIAALGVLEPGDPTQLVAGMLGEFKQFDPDGYEQLAAARPQLRNIPVFGKTSADSISNEQVLALNPDLAVFGVSGHGPSPDSAELLALLEAANVPVIFVDFRSDPLANTPKSITILGKALGREDQARSFVEFYDSELRKVTDTLAAASPEPPRVFLESHVGLSEEIRTMTGYLGQLLEPAGGKNIADGLLAGVAGTISMEYLLANQPDIYVGTAIGMSQSGESNRILLGPGASEETAQATLRTALGRKGIKDLEAVESGRAYAIWHHFYNHPFNVAALQAFAKWFHPELFADLNPDETLTTLYERFQPMPLSGVYWEEAAE